MENSISNYVKNIISDERILAEIEKTMKRGAINGGEASDSEENMESWFNNRFLKNSVILDETDYSRALIRSLWIAPNLAQVDFTAGRLRDFAQLWTDTARGFLGEIAVKKFLEKNYNINIYLENRRGKAKEFMASDILVIDKGADKPRDSKIKVSIKTTKLNGRWLEIPESQFKQSDVFVLVKLGISRYHFSSYIKHTVEQLLAKGLSINELKEEQVKELNNQIPEWNLIPAYISGFVEKAKLNLPIHELNYRTPKRRKKNADGVRPFSKIEIEGGIGLFSNSAIKDIPEIKKLELPSTIPVTIAGIGKKADGKFYATSGLLTFKEESWKDIVQRI